MVFKRPHPQSPPPRGTGRDWLLVSLLVFCLVGFFTSSAWAQLYSGSLAGVVTDPTGAVVPGAKVILTDVGKGFAFNATTDAVGRYTLRSLPPSTYKLTVEAQGFKTNVQGSITLDVNQNATIDVSLQLGTAVQTVEVTGAAPVLSTQDSVMGQELNRTFLNDLPLTSRSVFDLAFLAPGVTQPASSTFGLNGSGNNFVSNGGRNSTADILMDGVSTVNYEQNSGIQSPLYTPSVDAVQEFKLQQANFSADIGFTGATVINLVTRSGTNSFHGSVYEFLRNEKLDANNWFNNATSTKLPPLRHNLFGFTVGGPIRKDKTFFFFDYEGSRDRTMSSSRAGVPSALMREGNFAEICTAGFDATEMCNDPEQQLWDPYSGVYDSDAGGPVRSLFIPNNDLAAYTSPGNPKLPAAYQLPATPGNLIDPVAYKMMQYYPLPNIGAPGQAGYDRFNNWIGSGTNKGTGDQWDLKIDQRFSDKDLLSGKFSWSRGLGHGANCFGNVADPCTQGPGSGGSRVFALNLSHSFSPTTMLNFSYGIARSFWFTRGVAADFPDFDPVTTLGLPEYIKRSGVIATPTIYVYGGYGQVGGNDSIGSQAWSLMKYGQETHHLMASLNRIQGRHELKFGGEMRMHRIAFFQAGAPEGVFTFDFNSTSQAPWGGGGDAMASLLTGVGGPGQWGEYEITLAVSTQNFQYAGYFQDNWRVTDKLTLNLGIRYDLDLPRTERYNRMNWIDPDVASPLEVPGMPNLKGGVMFTDAKTRSPYDSDTNNLGPRFGFAYRLRPKTVLRGGYGLFYSLTKGGAAGTGAGGFQGFSNEPGWFYTYQGDGATPWGRLSDPWPIVGPAYPPGRSLGLLTNIGLGASGPIRSWNITPYEQTWSLGIQHELPWGVLIDAAYVGKKGTKLYFGGAGDLNHLGPDLVNWTEAEINALNEYVPNPFYGIITDPNSGLSGPEVTSGDLMRPHPQFSGFSGNDPPWANSIYHAFQLRVEKRMSKGLQFLATYTNSKSIDNASVAGGNVTWLGGFTSVQDPNRLFLERSLSEYDIPQVLQMSYVYQLPWGRGKKWGANWNPWLDGFLGGWQTNGIWRFDNGMPISLGLSGGESIPTYGAQRPNLLAPLEQNGRSQWTCDPYGSGCTGYFANQGTETSSSDVAVKPPRFTLGTAPRMLPNVRVPGTNTAALSLFKEIPLSKLREGSRIEFRVEAFNALNHPQFCGPHTTVEGGSFGKVTCQANSPREVQMALKFYW